MESIVIFGAGKIGRGFIGQLFAEAGYQLHFAEIDKELIAALNEKHEYRILEIDNEHEINYQIGPANAYISSETSEIVDLLAETAIAATAVGARNLIDIAGIFAKAIQQRMKKCNDAPLNILVCENLMNGARVFEQQIREHLNAAEIEFMEAHVGVVGSVVGRAVPPPPVEYQSKERTFIVVEPHRELYVSRTDFIGEIPVVKDMTITDDYDGAVSRKLYVHNCSHAILSYLGYLKGYQLSDKAMEDAEIFATIKTVMEESSKAVSAAYSFSDSEMVAYCDDLVKRYGNHPLGDTIIRIANDPIRKLQPSDRLVGAARLAEQAGFQPQMLAKGIAAAYCYDEKSDPMAAELQKMIQEHGIEQTILTVSQINPEEPLGQLVLENYNKLRN